MSRFFQRKSIVGLILAVLIAQLTGYHLHLCLHGDGPQTEVHTFAHEDVGCEQPNSGGPEPADIEIDSSDRGLLKTLKLAFDLPALPSFVAFTASGAPHERLAFVTQLPTLDTHRALRPPLRGPPV
jgi:hypothetical protein